MITFLDLRKYGGLGANMFQIASTIGIALKHGYDYGFPEWEDQHLFKNKLPSIGNRKFTQMFKTKVQYGYHNYAVNNNTSLHGWNYFQSWKYFEHCESLIRYYFELANPIKIKIPEDSVCIHVRRGDYHKTGRHVILDEDYYLKALKVLGNYYGDICIFSWMDDVPEWDFLQIATRFIGSQYDIDFKMMCKFKNHIISNSTFAWWPAWLSGEKVIAPKRWFLESSGLDSKDICPSNWMLI